MEVSFPQLWLCPVGKTNPGCARAKAPRLEQPPAQPPQAGADGPGMQSRAGEDPPSIPGMSHAEPAPGTACSRENSTRNSWQRADGCGLPWGHGDHPTQDPPQAQGPWMAESILQLHFVPLPSATALFHQLINPMSFCPRSGGPGIAALRRLEQLLSVLMESWEKSSPQPLQPC